MGKSKTECHDFYCINCGAHIPLARKRSKTKERFHRKKLYCYNCKNEINHIECKTQQDIDEFKENFKNGVYENERESSLCTIRMSRIG